MDFINLSSGLAWLETDDGPVDFRLVRIQSTACEQKRWAHLIDDLDYELLISLASGVPCCVWDASAKKAESRAIYQGLPWLRFAMELNWFGNASTPLVKGCNVAAYFSECYRTLPDRTISKLRYGRKFLRTEHLTLESRCMTTGLDGNYPALSALLGRAAHL